MMKKIFGLLLAVLLFGNVFGQEGSISVLEETSATVESNIEIPEELKEYEFNGILPSATRQKCEEKGADGSCLLWVNDDGYAQSEAGKLGKRIEEGTVRFQDIPIFIVKMIDFLTKLVGTVALLFMIYGGFQLMINQKDDGKTTIKYAIAGVFVAFLSWLVVNIVKTQFTGVDFYGNRVEESQQQ